MSLGLRNRGAEEFVSLAIFSEWVSGMCGDRGMSFWTPVVTPLRASTLLTISTTSSCNLATLSDNSVRSFKDSCNGRGGGEALSLVELQ